MRALLLIAVLGFILLAVGVLHYRSNQNEVTVTIDKQKGREVDRACNREGQRARIGNRPSKSKGHSRSPTVRRRRLLPVTANSEISSVI
jgi:hypothetical protein